MKKILLAIDIGNVCVKIDHANLHRQLGIARTPEAIKDLLREFEFGKLSDEEIFFNRAAEIFDRKFPAAKIKEAFNSIIIEPVPGMAELISTFPKRNIKAVFFSDISTTHLQRTRELFTAFDAVQGGIFSFKCGNWKPSEEMFSAFEKQYGIPDLYIDDRQDLIDAARQRPWNAQRFSGAEDLQKKLQALS